jgi:diaminohydroxyphosphoribosylaminopyrimidine deaminase/5-amino-6-(5-phosphoribosylamino)uracil reductase
MASDAARKDDVLVFCSSGEEKKKRELETLGVRVEQVSSASSDGRPDIRAVLRRLGQLEITSVLIEGGAEVNGSALAAGVADKIFLYYAPKILASAGSIPFAAGRNFHQIKEAPTVSDLHLHRFEEDFAVEGYLRDPYDAL